MNIDEADYIILNDGVKARHGKDTTFTIQNIFLLDSKDFNYDHLKPAAEKIPVYQVLIRNNNTEIIEYYAPARKSSGEMIITFLSNAEEYLKRRNLKNPLGQRIFPPENMYS